MIDDQEKRLIAMANRVPNIILMALYGVAIFAGAISGYGSGLEVQRARLPIYAMAFLVAAIILLIQDLDRPSAGFIKLSQQPMLDTATSISGFPD
jgi:hydrogenase/urease accessory protein HupE